MYVRVKEKSNNKLTIQIVESVRTGSKVSQKIVKHIGTVDANDTMMLDAIKRIAQDKLYNGPHCQDHYLVFYRN